MKITRKEKQQYNIIIISLYLFIFSSFFSNKLDIKVFNYFDELIGIFLFFMYISECLIKGRIIIYNNFTKYIIGLSVLVIEGLFSNIIYEIQPAQAVILDLIACLKFFFTLGMYYIILRGIRLQDISKKLAFHIKFIVKLILFLSILDYLFQIFDSQTRWGLPVLTLFYGHSTTFGDVCIFLIMLVLFFKDHIIGYKIYALGLSICSLATLRFKIVASMMLIYIIYYFVIKLGRKLTINRIFIIAITGVLIVSKQIQLYFFTTDVETARSALLSASFKILIDYFPIGTGFGTFASSASEKFYSQVYYQYNLYNVYGLHGDNTTFISDIFWPTIIGQFGFIGIITYIMLLIFLFVSIQKVYNEKKSRYFVLISLFIYMIMSTLSTSAFLSASGVMIAFGMSLMLTSK